MPTTYKTRAAGETFAQVSRRVYGSGEGAVLIAQANPGSYEPLPAGLDLIIPERAEDPRDSVQSLAPSDDDAVVIEIGGRRFSYWDGATARRSIDAVDTLELTSPFEPENDQFRTAFKPFSYPRMTMSIGGRRYFTGTLTTVKPVETTGGRAVAAGGYSLPGVLVDCCVPSSVYASGGGIEFPGEDLRRIAQRLLDPFGLVAVFMAAPGEPFAEAAIKPNEPIMPFLAKLAKQRALVITSDADGRVIFWQSVAVGNPVARLSTRAAGPVLSVTPEFNTQAYYSHITGIEPTSVGEDGGQHTERNSRLSGVLRPYTFQASDTSGVSLETATRAKIGRMFGDAVTYTVAVNTWRDPRGELWTPNTTVELEAPGAMVYTPYEFLIRDVTMERTAQGATAELSLVIPSAYRGAAPERMPWD